MELDTIYNMDCLEGMKDIPDGSIDMILCDLPYGTTNCTWDKVIPLNVLFMEYRRIIKATGAMALFASNAFTFDVVAAAREMFRYQWVWVKDRSTNFINAKVRPLPSFESILIFSKSPAANTNVRMEYYPQGLIPCRKKRHNSKSRFGSVAGIRPCKERYNDTFQEYENYPRDVLYFKTLAKKLHTSQKPVALCEYLIKTYTNPGELILDNCMGSGTTAVACINTGRRFIGYEKEKQYFDIATERIERSRVEMFAFV